MKTTRRAFLGRAAGASGIALATPWWVEWVGKFFGPTGHIHDCKVRTYAVTELAPFPESLKGWVTPITFSPPMKWVDEAPPRSNMALELQGIDPKTLALWNNPPPFTEGQLTADEKMVLMRSWGLDMA